MPDNWILNTEVKVYTVVPFLPLHFTRSPQKSILLQAIQKEIQRHDLSYFVSDPPSVAQGGKGVVVAGGCPACKKRINTISQFLDHLTNDAMLATVKVLCLAIFCGAEERGSEADRLVAHAEIIPKDDPKLAVEVYLRFMPTPFAHNSAANLVVRTWT